MIRRIVWLNYSSSAFLEINIFLGIFDYIFEWLQGAMKICSSLNMMAIAILRSLILILLRIQKSKLKKKSRKKDIMTSHFTSPRKGHMSPSLC